MPDDVLCCALPCKLILVGLMPFTIVSSCWSVEPTMCTIMPFVGTANGFNDLQGRAGPKCPGLGSAW